MLGVGLPLRQRARRMMRDGVAEFYLSAAHSNATFYRHARRRFSLISIL